MGWNRLVVTESYQHPAKFSRALIQRIYQHAREEGWLAPGTSTVLDPFGGVSLGALDAALAGIQHVSVELEARFHQLALANVALWTQRYGHLPQWVPPVCLQGDSRQLAMLLQGQADAVVSSPPYADRCSNDNQRTLTRDGLCSGHNEGDGQTYGHSSGQLAALPPGSVEAVLSSPPYADGCTHTGGADPQPQHIQGGAVQHVAYGSERGQLGAMAAGRVEAAIAEELTLASQQNPDRMLCRVHNKLSGDSVWQSAKTAEKLYHEDRVGACPAEESIAANPSQPAKTADRLSVVAPNDAAPARRLETAKRSRGKRLPQNTGARSVSLPPADVSVPRRKTNSGLHNSPMQPNPFDTPRLGEVLASEVSAATFSSEISMPASSAAEQAEGSLFITSETATTLEASGIIATATYKPSADGATLKPTQQPNAPVSNVEHFSGERISEVVSAPLSVVDKDATDSIACEGQPGGPDTFWHASKEILQQVFSALKPNGHAIWVVKDYVRNGQIVPFSQQWKTLCEHVGFVTLHEHHALLVEHHGTQEGLFGEATEHRTERKSFFRRLHEKRRPDLAIDFEVVLCMVKESPAMPMPPDAAWEQLPLVEAVLASPPFSDTTVAAVEGNISGRPGGRKASALTNVQGNIKQTGYGTHPAQLGNLPPGTLDAVVASPPYVQSVHDGNGIDATKLTGNPAGTHSQAHAEGYGTHPAQLGNLPPGSIDAVLSSPPYSGNAKSDYLLSADGKTRQRDVSRGYAQGHGCFRGSETYGQSPGQLGAMREGPAPTKEHP
jgi:hypothetical protein